MKLKALFLKSILFLLGGCGIVISNGTDNYLGVDLSYVNQMEDCGGKYFKNGKQQDPFELFKFSGANIVRVRLWHSPQWTNYSNFEDVKKTIRRSKTNGMQVLLDFHYSDTWADPDHQIIPAAWRNIESTEVLKDTVYAYTYNVLQKLELEGLSPEFVQIGNEINIEVMQQNEEMHSNGINWQRNITLLNAGIKGVRNFNRKYEKNTFIMLHIAQPEHALWWFSNAYKNEIDDFDWIGLSYYPAWSTESIEGLGKVVSKLSEQFKKRIMVVETAYPYTLIEGDSASNIMDKNSLVEGFVASPKGQFDYLVSLTKTVLKNGGEGVIYWEPGWISTSCRTRWGRGSHWDNATFFDAQNQNEALEGINFLSHDYYQ